jgi:energy-coupling factor transporter ATP-binding protein EcfA2
MVWSTNSSVLLIGNSGCGKTRTLYNILSNIDTKSQKSLLLQLTRNTSFKKVKSSFESELVKKSDNIYTQIEGKHLLVGVEDVNLPHSTQLTEYLRQISCFGSWLDTKIVETKYLTGVNFLITCRAVGPDIRGWRCSSGSIVINIKEEEILESINLEKQNFGNFAKSENIMSQV